MRGFLIACAVIAVAAPARADEHDAKVAGELLAEIASAPSGPAKQAATAKLVELGPRVVDTLGAFLGRPRTTTLDERRAVLASINASIPDKNGRFVVPKRKDELPPREGDDFDWLAELAGSASIGTPVFGEVMADVAAMRALVASRQEKAAVIIFDVAFAEATMIYRDECGRQLRKMHPYSIPAMIRIAQSKTNRDRRRYANYQLQRMDREDAGKALLAASVDEALEIAVLEAFHDTKHREAVFAVLAKIDDDATRVRAAARKTWLGYVTGPPPPPAPKKKLEQPGGKLAEKETPLWLTYRELADLELRKIAEELWGEVYGEKQKLDLGEMSQRLFAHHDAERAKKDAVLFGEAKVKVDAGDLAAATAILDRLLVNNPDRPEKAEMAQTYLAYGDTLAKSQRWRDAAAAYSKAHGLDPQGPHATHALASHHLALGRALQSEGKDGGAQFRRAATLEPSNEIAQRAAGKRSSRWMLIAGGSAAALALIFTCVGLLLRRRPPLRG